MTASLEVLRRVLARIPTLEAAPPVDLAETIRYLESADARASMEADPYWPKWDGPWWRMTLLFELGEARRIPRACVERMIARMNSHYLKFFPVRQEEVPPGTDPYRHLACHCQLGTLYQVLTACGVDVDAEIPWIRPWFLKYQLPDGGLNCDDSVYPRDAPRSSMVSTLPPLEAVLLCTSREFTAEETGFLDRGAEYLLRRKIFRSVSGGGRVIREEWLAPCFPRFYGYDILRGLRFVARWAERRRRTLPAEAIAEVVSILDGNRTPRRFIDSEMRTRQPEAPDAWHPARSFMLLDDVSVRPGFVNREWVEALETLARLDRAGLLG